MRSILEFKTIKQSQGGEMTKCIICDSTECVTDIPNNKVLINCKKGYKFKLDLDVYDLNKSKIRKLRNLVVEWLLTHQSIEFYSFYYDEHTDFLIKSDKEINLYSLLLGYPKRINEKVERILVNFSKKYPTIGSQIGLDEIDSNYLFVDSDNYVQESRGMYSMLEEMGFLKRLTGNSDIFTLTAKAWGNIENIENNKSNSSNVFIAMKFGEETVQIREYLRTTLFSLKFNPVLIDEKEHNNQIVPEILYQIDKCRFLILELTCPNFGAYYEAGYALGKGKEVIVCCRKDIFNSKNKKRRPHFDLAQKSIVVWETEIDLKKKLSDRINATIKQGI